MKYALILAALLAGCGVSERSIVTAPYPNRTVFLNDTELGSSGEVMIVYGPDGKIAAVGSSGTSLSVMGAATDILSNTANAALITAASKLIPNVNENISVPASATK